MITNFSKFINSVQGPSWSWSYDS